MIWSSCSVQALFLIFGLRWLCHRSRHCLPMRPLRWRAITVHFLAPYLLTSSITFSSSCEEQIICNAIISCLTITQITQETVFGVHGYTDKNNRAEQQLHRKTEELVFVTTIRKGTLEGSKTFFAVMNFCLLIFYLKYPQENQK